ncbi:MAG: hypothetical protein FWE27_02645 [Defluviitaleaceae bacterium]|nr:hypothetical protein [Defluviitaleaceae bacterium]
MQNFYIGQVVYNFGIIAKVVGFHRYANGELSGDIILRELWNKGSGDWAADPALIEPYYEREAEVLRHKDGLVAFG